MISWKLKTRNYWPIGLDIGHSSIKMIQLADDAGRINVIAADKVYLDPGLNDDLSAKSSFIISAIRRMLQESDFNRRDVVSCLPNGQLKITSLRLACTKDENIAQTLQKEVKQRLGLDSDKDVIDYILAGSVLQGDKVKNELVLFAADEQTVKNHIQILKEANLRPIAIDTVPNALFRSLERLLKRQQDRERTAVFVDVGKRFTTVVFGAEGKISFVKQIPIGGENFNSEISAKLGIDASEAAMLRDKLKIERTISVENSQSQLVAGTNYPGNVGLENSTRQVIVDAVGTISEKLAREISLCFRYYTVTFRGKRVERAIIAGGEAYENILLDVFKKRLAVDVEVAQPLRGMDITNVTFDSDRRGLLSEWSVAVGLSLRGCKTNNISDVASKDYERN